MDDMSTPTEVLETAILGGGCFWCLEAVFERVRGLVAVQSGYCGGHVEAPTYREVSAGHTGHAEVVRVLFDPAIVSYSVLLEIFFTIHDPTTLNRQGHDVGTQYRSVIFAADAAQLALAKSTLQQLGSAKIFPAPIVTQCEIATAFWPAEPEHDQYYTQHQSQPYCAAVISPKVQKFKAQFQAWWK